MTPANLAARTAARIKSQERLPQGYLRDLAPPPRRDPDRAPNIVIAAIVLAIVFICSFPFLFR